MVRGERADEKRYFMPLDHGNSQYRDFHEHGKSGRKIEVG